MAEATDEQVAQARELVDDLNKQIAEEKQKASVQASGNINDLRLNQLNTEAERLMAELTALRAANEVAPTVVEQVTTPPTPAPAPLQTEVTPLVEDNDGDDS